MKSIYGIIAAVAMTACSIENQDPSKDKKDGGDGSGSGSSSTTAAQQNGAKASSSGMPSTQGGYLTGYVVSAFDVQVNGEKYSDSEDFYSHELQDLQEQADAAGYDGYTMTFDGQLGLDDLKYGMNVYVAAEGNTGFAGDTQVRDSGRFSLAIPDGSGDDTFQVRTNKRVSVMLTSPDKKTTVTWCYNFSSVNTQATLQDPVLVSEFVTTLTKYKCSNANGGMQIPMNPKAAPVVVPAPASTPAPAVAGAASSADRQ